MSLLNEMANRFVSSQILFNVIGFHSIWFYLEMSYYNLSMKKLKKIQLYLYYKWQICMALEKHRMRIVD